MPLSELSGLTLQVGDQKGGTESLLRAAGALDDLPYKIAFSTFTSGPPQIEAATAGKIDFAITGNTPPIFGAAANAKVKVVSAYDGSGRGDRLLVHADSPIRSVTDLRGKRIAVGKGSSAHGNVLAQLNRAGLSPSDVTLVFLQPADALGAFTQRQVDVWAVWDPYTAQAEADIPVRSIAEADRRHQRRGLRHRVRRGAGRPETQHRPERPARAVREGRAVGEGPPRPVGGELRGRRRPRPGGRRRIAGAQPEVADRTVRRVGRIGTEARRPVRRIQADRRPRRSSTTGSTAATAMRSTRF